MTLCGGQGRSLKLNCFVDEAGREKKLLLSTRGPSIVDNSPGEKLSIVDDIVVCPHVSDASMVKKFPYMEGEVLKAWQLTFGFNGWLRVWH